MSDTKSYLDELAGNSKPESFQDEVFEPAKRSRKPFIVTGSIIAIAILGFIIYTLSNRVTIPDYTTWSVEELSQWAQEHNITPTFKSVYNYDQPVNQIIDSNLTIGETVSKNASLSFTYSLGPDPNEAIELADFKGMQLEDIQSFIDENKATGITIKKENSEVVAQNEVINYEFKDGSFDNYLRKNRLVVYISEGPANPDDTFKMPDLIGKSKSEAIDFMNKQNVTITFEYAFNENIVYDQIYAQSIKAETKITRSDPITLTLSKGKEITVPDFVGLSREQVNTLAEYHKISIYFKHEVSSQEPGTALDQDIVSGSSIDTNQLITVTLAKESQLIAVPDFIGLSKDEASQLGALKSLNIFFRNVDSTETIGTVIGQSTSGGQWLEKDSILTIDISKGLMTMPDLTGMDRIRADIEAEKLGFKIVYREVENESFTNGTVLNQNVSVNETIEPDTTVLCDIASNSGTKIIDLQDMTRSEAEAWANDNGITLSIVELYHNDHPSGKLFEQSSIGTYALKTKPLTIKLSLGKVVVYDFIGKTKVEVVEWMNSCNAKGAELQVLYTLTTSTKEKRGIVTDQSIISDYVRTGTTVVVTVSATNNGISIPSLTKMGYSEFIDWAAKNEVPYIVTDAYSDTYSVDKMFGQNYTNKSLPNGKILEIKRSLGKVPIDDYSGLTKTEAENAIAVLNSNSANIKVTYVDEASGAVPEGNVIRNTDANATVNTGTTITVTLSTGP